MNISLKSTAISAVLALSAAGAMAQQAGNFPIFEPSATRAVALSDSSPAIDRVSNARTPAVEANAQMAPVAPMASEDHAAFDGGKYGPDAAVNSNAELPPEPYAQSRSQAQTPMLGARDEDDARSVSASPAPGTGARM